MFMNLLISVVLAIFCLGGAPCLYASQGDNNSYIIGTNLGLSRDFSGDWPFIDRMKNARPWITFDATGVDKTWDTKVDLPLDQQGYPLEIPYDPDGNGPIPPQAVRTFLFNSYEGYPAGEYSLIFDGKGKLHVRVDAFCPDLPNDQCIFTEPGISHRFFVKSPTKGGVRLKIYESARSDHVRNIRVYLPDNHQAQEEVFHPQYIERLNGFEALRFMDWQSINHSTERKWDDRVKQDYISFAHKGKGIPYEQMIMLANKLGADAWFCVPTFADDDYIRNMARLIDRSLKKGLGVYIEYSNEVWNSIFQQKKYATSEGNRIAESFGLDIGTKEANALFYAKRSAEVFNIFQQEMAKERDLTKVVSGQCMNPRVLKSILEWLGDERVNPSGVQPDAIAVALYFGGQTAKQLLTKNGTVKTKEVTAQDVEELSLDDILTEAHRYLLEKRVPKIVEHRKLATAHDMKLVAYEGGQALRIGYGFTSEVLKAMTKKLIEVNRHPKIKQLYQDMFRVWFSSGGEDFMNFSYINQPNRWGMWGILERQNQSLQEVPKYQAVIEAVEHY